ncbi:MAG TPA: tetratricopeptide repeat protein [Candidatus Limnocylindrales bacterium]|nr:tetratricopeptide repeat protein [Candidatus Limnocylindrales bacterium]
MPGEASETQIQELELVVERDPSTALYLPLAERLRDMGRVEDAIRLCEARRTRPGRGVGDSIVLGRCYLADGRLAEARSEFEAALRLDRENVIALKALAGILAHEGRHTVAVELYRAVCRIDPGDLESQTALHQITSGEFAEVSPADVVVGQGDLGWHPVRLPREEDHMADLAMGLRMIDTFETPAPAAERAAERGLREFSLDDLERKKPAPAPGGSGAASAAPVSPSPPPAVAGPAAPPPAATRHADLELYDVPTPVRPEEERLEGLGAPIETRPAQARPARDDEARVFAMPAPSPRTQLAPPADTAPPEPAAAPGEATPDLEAAGQGSGQGKRDEAAYKPGVSGNRSAFQDWLRRLGGGS